MRTCHVPKKPNAWQCSMMSVESKNVYGNPGLQRPNFTLKMSYLRVKFGLCNLGFPYTFLESAEIIQHCYVLSFLGTYQPLPYLRFKHPVGYILTPHYMDRARRVLASSRFGMPCYGETKYMVLMYRPWGFQKCIWEP